MLELGVDRGCFPCSVCLWRSDRQRGLFSHWPTADCAIGWQSAFSQAVGRRKGDELLEFTPGIVRGKR